MTSVEDRLQQLSPVKRALYQQRMAALRSEPIAIVGLGLRFPGGVVDAESYWSLLSRGVDAISEVPKSRWDADALYDPDPDAPGRVATRWGGFLEGLDRFDPEFFGMTAREAIRLDPQQRLLLEVAHEALESAGIAPASLGGSRTGVFVGLTLTDSWFLQLSDRLAIDVHTATGTALHSGAGRLAYVLGLTGPAITVDTACSSTLVSLHMACQSLRSGEVDLALAGGASVLLAPESSIALSRMHVLSVDGRCKVFDESADGYVRAEGSGLVVLQRLPDARAAGRPVRALIRGSAVNQDGRRAGLTVPNGPAQQALIRSALAAAGLQPEDVGYVEAHGLGSKLGDQIELEALASVFSGRRAEPLVVGSVKSNLGHMESASGIAGLLKAVLCLERGEIPPQLHFKKLHPDVGARAAAMRIPTERMPWNGAPRVAGVSTFSMMGTNAHVVLEAAQPAPAPTLPRRPVALLLLSGKTEAALVEAASRYERHLSCAHGLAVEDACFTAAVGRSHHPHRLAVVGRSLEQLRERLEAIALGRRIQGMARGVVRRVRPRVAFLFAGHGSQYSGMGRLLYETEPVFKAAFDECARLLEPKLERPLGPLTFGSQGENELEEIRYGEPALFALQHGLVQLWRAWGVVPAAVMGHGAGEISAAVAAGVLSLEDGAMLVAERSRLMGSLPREGRMLVVMAELPAVAAVLEETGPGIAIAAVDGPRRVVVSGAEEALARLTRRLSERQIPTRSVPGSALLHSPLVEPVLDALERAAASVRHGKPRCQIISSLTGEVVRSEVPPATYWRRQACEPVQFARGMTTLASMSTDAYLEIGSQSTLIGLGRACLPDVSPLWLQSLGRKRDDREQILETLGCLHACGVEIDWTAFHRGWAGRVVPLPSYPFQRRRLWIAPSRESLAGHRLSTSPSHPLLGARLRTVATVFENALSTRAPAYLEHHRVGGKAVLPAAAVVEMALAAGENRALAGLEMVEPLVLPGEGPVVVQTTVQEDGGREGKAWLQVHSLDGEKWRLHARASLEGTRVDGERVDLEPIRARCGMEIDPAAYRALLAAKGVDLGTSFWTIAGLHRSEGESVGRLVLPPGVSAGGHLLHPALLDGALRTLAAADPREVAEAGAVADLVPARLESVRLLGHPGARELWCHGRFERPGEPSVGDLHLLLPTGELVAELRGIRMERMAEASVARAELAASTTLSLDGPPERLRATLDAFLRAELGRVLVTDGNALAGSQSLFEVGLDSLLAVDLRRRLAKGLRRALPPTLLLTHPSIDAILEYLEAELGGGSAPDDKATTR